jgi:sec-independent protein translocase protein TatC
MSDAHDDHSRMSLGDHLGELRYRLVMGLVGPLIAAIGLLVYGKSIVAWLCQPALYALAAKGLNPTLFPRTPQSAFTIYLKVCFIGGLLIGIPWLLYQLWKFVAPGLYPRERRFVYYLVPGSAALSIAGLAFMYYILLPITLSFLIAFSLSYPMPEMTGTAVQRKIEALYGSAGPDGDPINQAPAIWPQRYEDPTDPADGMVWINVPKRSLNVVIGGKVHMIPMTLSQHMAVPWFTMGDYISFAIWLAIGCGLGFQLPMVMLGLSWAGLVPRRVFASGRKWAVLACVTAAAILTPPDVASQLLLGASMYLLYEFGLLLVLVFKPGRERALSDGSGT